MRIDTDQTKDYFINKSRSSVNRLNLRQSVPGVARRSLYVKFLRPDILFMKHLSTDSSVFISVIRQGDQAQEVYSIIVLPKKIPPVMGDESSTPSLGSSATSVVVAVRRMSRPFRASF